MSSGMYFKVGVFVVVAATLAVAGIFAVGVDELSEDVVVFETYMDESVQGLDVGALVKARGVPMGRVTAIDFVANRYEASGQGLEGLIYIEFELSQGIEELDEAKVTQFIDEGLRIRLTSAGITGAMFLEMDLAKDASPPPVLAWTPRNRYVPAEPSTMKRFSEKAENVLEGLEDLDLGAIGEKVRKVLDETDELIAGDLKTAVANAAEASGGISEAVADLRTRVNDELLVEVNGLVKDMRGVVNDDLKSAVRRIDEAAAKLPEDVDRFLRKVEDSTLGDLGAVLENIERTTAELPATVASVNQTLRRIDLMVAGQQANLETSLTNFRRITEDMQELVEDAKRHPSLILFGDAPARAKAVRNRDR